MSQQLGITTAHDGLPMYESGPQTVIVKNIDMSIANMCLFMVKWAIAAIPVAIILFFLFLLLAFIFGGLIQTILK